MIKDPVCGMEINEKKAKNSEMAYILLPKHRWNNCRNNRGSRH